MYLRTSESSIQCTWSRILLIEAVARKGRKKLALSDGVEDMYSKNELIRTSACERYVAEGHGVGSVGIQIYDSQYSCYRWGGCLATRSSSARRKSTKSTFLIEANLSNFFFEDDSVFSSQISFFVPLLRDATTIPICPSVSIISYDKLLAKKRFFEDMSALI